MWRSRTRDFGLEASCTFSQLPDQRMSQQVPCRFVFRHMLTAEQDDIVYLIGGGNRTIFDSVLAAFRDFEARLQAYPILLALAPRIGLHS